MEVSAQKGRNHKEDTNNEKRTPNAKQKKDDG